MLLNFPLDRRVWPYTGLNLECLFDGIEEGDAAILEIAGSYWIYWGRCLVGFKPSPCIPLRPLWWLKKWLREIDTVRPIRSNGIMFG
jgi:hypothetical protein